MGSHVVRNPPSVHLGRQADALLLLAGHRAARRDADRSAVRERYTDPATGRFNPAEMDAETRARMRFEMEEAERAAVG
jgi:hypothetical protein